MLKTNLFKILIVFFYLISNVSIGQPLGVLKHFSHDEKLSQSRIIDIQQDKKGFIWLATFNGLIRYDGNSFLNFKVVRNASLNLKSNRIFHFEFDKNERIWIQSENNEIYYFDTQTLSFHHPIKDKAEHTNDISFKKFRIMPSGRVWLFLENENYMLVYNNKDQIKKVVLDGVQLSSNDIYDVFEDTSGKTWLLTKAGICKLNNEDVIPEYYFFNKAASASKSLLFSTVMETEEEIWFGGLNGRLVRYAKKVHTYIDFKSDIKGDIVRIESLKNNKVVVFTRNNGFYCFDVKTGELHPYNSETLKDFPKGNITFLGITKAKELWFDGDGAGIYQFNFETNKLNNLTVQSKDPATIGTRRKTLLLTDPNGVVWVQPKDGALSYLDESNNKLISIVQCVKGNRKEVYDIMYTAMFDELGNLWFSSLKEGLDLLVFNNSFSRLNLNTTNDIVKHNVRSLMQDRKGVLWVASRSQKITLIDSHKNVIGYLGADGTLSKDSPSWGADIYHMMQDANDNIWIGTRGNGLFYLTPTDRPFVYNVKNYKYKKDDVYSLSSNDIYNIFQASSGTVCIATWGGGINFVQTSKKEFRFINYRNELKNYPIKTADKIRTIVENKDQELFFITPYELFSFSSKKNSIMSQLTFVKYPEVSGSDILDILVTSDNQLVLATNGKGVLFVDIAKNKKVEMYVPIESMIGFPIEGVMAIQDDILGNIWLMGENQIVRFNLKDKAAETFPELKLLIETEIISEASRCLLKNGEIVVGYSNGAIYFNPNSIKPLEFKPHLSISSFTVYNKELYEVNPKVKKNPDLLEEVTLKHNQNFFRIHLSALTYIKNDNVVYRYKLEGFEKEWNYFKGAQSINYTGLSQGKYKLVMASTNNHNLWVDNERSIDIIILPSIWRTNVAYMCYFIIVVIMLFMVKRTIMTILKLRNDVHMEKQIAELKLKFFTDISHEIRTPLTMITAPVEKMLADDDTPMPIKNQLKIIERSSNKLLNLVNQILDLRRIQNRKLYIKEINLNDFITTICQNFKELSLQRKIHLKLNLLTDKSIIWADSDSLDKIVLNLISNAFKYCREGDVIEVILEETNKHVILKIKDNGPGISSEVKKRLFMRFSSYNIKPSNPSTGIGLSIVKELVDKHGATISLNSEVDKGACFELCFLKKYKHFNEDVDIVFETIENTENTEISRYDSNEEVLSTLLEEKHDDKKVGLIVEDDPELRSFMIAILEKDYTIYEAENGDEGYKKAIKLLPDFIISDIMMPIMDGIEMLKLIRNNPESSHLPVVLLTAKTTIESRLEGMEYGADEYLIKPFNISFLKARIKNILEQRKRLQFLYSSGNIKDVFVEEEPLQISNRDHEFMLKVIDLINENMMKTDFSVEELGSLMNMSRASFFNKLKALSGVSPVKFIRDMKLNKAANLIKTDNLLIKEICFQVGFNDLKYFGKCFKEKFNYTPAEYRRFYR